MSESELRSGAIYHKESLRICAVDLSHKKLFSGWFFLLCEQEENVNDMVLLNTMFYQYLSRPLSNVFYVETVNLYRPGYQTLKPLLFHK